MQLEKKSAADDNVLQDERIVAKGAHLKLAFCSVSRTFLD
jgi:hypothetical protein